jgi:translation initiation factor IF-1
MKDKMNKDLIEMEGDVAEVLPGNMFRVKIDSTEHVMLCYLSGRLKKHKIKIVLADRVKVEASAYDLTKGRIVYRN